MPNIEQRNRVRVGGSGFTFFTFMNQPLAFAQQVDYVSPGAVSGPVAIQPMDERHPVQIITPAAAGMGALTLNLYELYNSKVWERLGSRVGYTQPPGNGAQNSASLGESILAGAIDIADIFQRVAEQKPSDLSVVKHIRPPKIAGNVGKPYMEIYNNCVITDVRDGESIQVGTMEVIKQITVGFTHITRPERSPNWGTDVYTQA